MNRKILNIIYFLIAPEVEDPEDGWNSQEGTNGQDKALSKDADESMDTDSSLGGVRKKAPTYDIALEAPPKDGNDIIDLINETLFHLKPNFILKKCIPF